MSEKDLKIVRELFNTAKENFERDGYLAPVLFAWALEQAPAISLIEGNPRDVLPGMCDNLRLLGYDRFALIIEGWIVMGEENLKDIENWVGRMPTGIETDRGHGLRGQLFPIGFVEALDKERELTGTRFHGLLTSVVSPQMLDGLLEEL